jgi:cellulose synthase/poly-beta-1,6-N-acetylglucosamine synthase-like glycosyltransferase
MLLNIFYFTWFFFQFIIGIMLVFPLLSYFIYILFKSRFRKSKIVLQMEADYGVIITAYKDLSNIPYVVNSLLKQDYTNYLVYVVADNCPRLETDFTDERVIILYPDSILQNQLKSQFHAIDNFKRNHNRLTIIDSDNLVAPDYLNQLNKVFDKGYQAVQGVRKAKNFDTPYACLDAANEIYYFFYNRKVLFGIGSSCMLSGSGMAFTTSLFKDCLQQHVESEGAGFDKILQTEIINKGFRIAFAEYAIVYDEKTSLPDQLIKQRARWNNTWFRFFNLGFNLILQGIFKISINRFVFGFILVRPPLFLLLGLSFIIMAINFFINTAVAIIWIFLIVGFTAGFFIALNKSNTDKRIYKALTHIPKFVYLQVLSLFKIRKANQYSVATEHLQNREIEKS